MRTIRVTGKGQLKVKPDMTRITMSLEGTFPEYSDALRRSAEDTERIKDLLSGFGFERTDLKTLNFNVETEYESYKEHGTYKQRFVGYKYHHLMKVEFESDNERLGKLLYALAHCPVKPEFRLSYTVKDPEAAKNELLGKAIADAKEKATVLTTAAGVTLKSMLYCGRNGLKPRINDEDTIGVPLDAYIPDLKLAFLAIGRGTKTENDTQAIAKHLCERRGIVLEAVSYRASSESLCMDIKRAFQEAHVYFISDFEEDIEIAHTQFYRWRR